MGHYLSKHKTPNTTTPLPTEIKAMAPLAFSHFAGAQTSFKPPLIANENAFLGDVATSQEQDPVAPISAGFYRLEKGTPLVYEYTYHEMKIIVDGEFDIADETGQKVHAVKGDVFYCKLIIQKGDSYTEDMANASQSPREARLHSPRILLVWVSLLGNERYVVHLRL